MSRVGRTRARAERGLERARVMRGVPVVLESFTVEQRAGASLLAGGLAYRFFFWLVPAGLVVAALASFWVLSSRASLEDAAKSFGIGGVAARSAASAVDDGSRARWYFLVAGLFFVAYFGLGAVRSLRVTAFIAWRIKPARLRHPFQASAAFSGIFLAAFAITVGESWVREQGAILGLWVTVAGSLAYGLLALVGFEHLPRPEGTTRRALLPGAVLTGCGITAVNLLVVYYLAAKLERSPKLYGALGASTVVLLALFMVARLIVSAMFLNATLDRQRRPQPEVSAELSGEQPPAAPVANR